MLVLGAVGMVAPFVWMFATSMLPSARAHDLPPTWFATTNLVNYRAAVNSAVPILRNLGTASKRFPGRPDLG